MQLLSTLFLTSAGFAAIAAFPAQQSIAPQQSQSNPSQATSHEKKTNTGDGYLAAWLMVYNKNEIELARIAQQRAQNPEVKQFAQKMIDEHDQVGQKLRPYAALIGPDGRPTAAGETTEPGQPQEASSGRVDVSKYLDHTAMIQELSNQRLESARKELEEKQGAEFDRCFVNMMVYAHMEMNDTMTVFERHASATLKNLIHEGQKVATAHFDLAQELSKRLDKTKS